MKMKYVDIGISVLFIVALVVIYFFWGCKWDMYITILVSVIIVITGISKYVQYKKLKELTSELEEK